MRLRALDGLRGVAALVVLVHHCFASLPVLGGVYAFPRGEIPSAVHWLVFSPLHLVWAGQEAVYVFFVLSGLVLTLPAFQRRYAWRTYYPSRILRLYLPVAASVGLALLVVALVPRSLALGRGDWMNDLAVPPTLAGVVRDVTLARPDLLNGPLWSLRWEVIFSLLLPLYLWVAMRLSRFPWLLLAASLGLSLVGQVTGRAWLMYLPVFMLGVALAVALQRPVVRIPRRLLAFVAGGASVGLTASWWTEPIGKAAFVVAFPVVLLSATALVFLAVRWVTAQRLLETLPLQWLGRRSFSLYLVHYPIVVAIASLVPPEASLLTVAIGLPLSLVVSELFFRAIEAPAHRLAKKVGRALQSQTPASTAT